MEFEEACCEMNYILEHMNPIDKNKIPKSVIKFFKENRSLTYKVKLTTEKSLEEQNLKDATKAFITILNVKYLFNESEKVNFMNQLEENVIEKKGLTIYKENKLTKLIKKILGYFKKK